jgi:hypothetical protein
MHILQAFVRNLFRCAAHFLVRMKDFRAVKGQDEEMNEINCM